MTNREESIINKILSYDTYVRKEGISASALHKPPLQLKLLKDNPNHQSDVKNHLKLNSGLGTSWHSFCEKAMITDSEFLTEAQLENNIDGTKATCALDLIDLTNGNIYDHKSMQAWKANILWDKKHPKHSEYIEEFKDQMSQIKWLWNNQKENHITCNKTYIIVWVIDWKKPYIRKDNTSKPTAPKFFIIEIQTYKEEEFIAKFNQMVNYVAMEYDELPQCPECINQGWRWEYCDVKSICPKINKGF